MVYVGGRWYNVGFLFAVGGQWGSDEVVYV